MKEFDYIIIGGGCAGLSLAYELEIHNKLENKTLAIVEPRDEYKRDKTWSFWKVSEHNFDDCIALSGYMPNADNYKSTKIKVGRIFIAHGFSDQAISFDDYKNNKRNIKEK